jgi:DNA-binding transcriptional regulator YdaS (Cro superfamily)
MKLAEYKLKHGLTLTALAAEIGVSVPTCHGWLKGKTLPSWASILLIEAATKGAVTADDFVPTLRGTPRKLQA